MRAARGSSRGLNRDSSNSRSLAQSPEPMFSPPRRERLVTLNSASHSPIKPRTLHQRSALSPYPWISTGLRVADSGETYQASQRRP
eukprot:2619814-Rhodomonas_salina.1